MPSLCRAERMAEVISGVRNGSYHRSECDKLIQVEDKRMKRRAQCLHKNKRDRKCASVGVNSLPADREKIQIATTLHVNKKEPLKKRRQKCLRWLPLAGGDLRKGT